MLMAACIPRRHATRQRLLLVPQLFLFASSSSSTASYHRIVPPAAAFILRPPSQLIPPHPFTIVKPQSSSRSSSSSSRSSSSSTGSKRLSTTSSSSSDIPLRTVVPVTPRPPQRRLHPADPLFFLGSCFSDNMGGKLKENLKMKVEINPFGKAYNPVSIAGCLGRLATGRPFEQAELGQHPQDGRWFSFDHHTTFSARNPTEALSNINTRLAQGHVSLKKAKHVFLTLGTAHAYVLVPKEGEEEGRVVANCHRLPAARFRRELLNIPDIVTSLQAAIRFIRAVNPVCTITFTVSPVRHLRNAAGDAVQSARSKAHLLTAVHQVLDEDALSSSSSPSSPSSSSSFSSSSFSSSLLSYFPAYELMMDDLRDYRFYASDMLHPSPLALEYIYSRFSDAYLDSSPPSLLLRKDLETLRRNLQHRPFDETSPAHQLFLKQQVMKMEGLQATWPHLDFKAERAVVRKGLVE